MSDPRYRNGVFKGNGSKAQMAQLRQKALAECNPLTYGWHIAYFNTQYGLHVYTLSTFKMMRHPDPKQDGWIVEDTVAGQQSHRQGSMADITANVKAELPAPATAADNLVKASLQRLKESFNSNPPTAPAPAAPSSPRPFPKVSLSPETLELVERDLARIKAKNQAGEQALQLALKSQQPRTRIVSGIGGWR